MSEFNSNNRIDLDQINEGKKFKKGDGINPNDLNQIVEGVAYATENGGGTQVEANPTDEATEELNKLKVGDTTYSIPEGGGIPQEELNKYQRKTDTSLNTESKQIVGAINELNEKAGIVIEDDEFPYNLSVSTFVDIHNLLVENKYKSILIKGTGINVDGHSHNVTLGQVCSWNASGSHISGDLDAFSITALVDGKMYKYTIHEFFSPENYGTISVEEVNLSQGNYELIEKIIIGYSVLETKPDDWETNYSSYYQQEGEGLDLHYVPISSPDFPVDYAYSFDPDAVVGSLEREEDLYRNPYRFKKILFYSNAPQATAQSTGYVQFDTDYKENGYVYGSQVNVQRFAQTNNKTSTVAIAKIENGRLFVEGYYGSGDIVLSITGFNTGIGSTGLGVNWMKREPKANYITKVKTTPSGGLPANTEVYIYGVK